MAQLTRATPRPPAARSKLLLVRQPVRSVRRGDQPDALPLRLALGTIVALGVVGLVWLIGHLGFRLGFAPLVRVPELMGEPGSGLATGTMIVVLVPRVIFEAGLAVPLWLMVGFLAIAVPAGALGAARPQTPGGPRLRSGPQIIAGAGAAATIVAGGLLLWWTASPARASLMGGLPLDPADAASWHADMATVAGLDVLAVVSAALWMVLAFRLPITRWLRAIASSATLFTLVVLTVAMAMTNASAAHLGAGRSRCVLDDGTAAPRLILGSTPHHLASMVVYDGTVVVELRNHPDAIAVDGRQSIRDFLADRAAE